MGALDEFLSPVAEVVAGLADLDAALAGPGGDLLMSLESARLDLPLELHVEVGEDGTARIISAPPTQQVATTWMPVMHRLRLRVAREEAT